MNVGDVLTVKGSDVKMIAPTETIGFLSRQLQQCRIGVMLVSQDGVSIDGIISERDVAYSLADRRGELHLVKVSALMTRRVISCPPETTLTEAAEIMNKNRIRHLPVVEAGRVVGIISIRDVLEHRIDEIERKTTLLSRLITTKYD